MKELFFVSMFSMTFLFFARLGVARQYPIGFLHPKSHIANIQPHTTVKFREPQLGQTLFAATKRTIGSLRQSLTYNNTAQGIVDDFAKGFQEDLERAMFRWSMIGLAAGLVTVTVFVGNLVSALKGKHQLAWGITGTSVASIGVALSLGLLIKQSQNGGAVFWDQLFVSSLIIQSAVLGLSIYNVVQGRRRKNMLASVPWVTISQQNGSVAAGWLLMGKF